MINLWLVAALVFIGADWLAIWKQRPSVNFLTKPFALLCLLIWFWSTTGSGWINVWFLLGFFFSLAGDGFLLLPPSYFKLGLGAFLLAHLSYLIGLASGVNVAAGQFWIFAMLIGALGVLSVRPLIVSIREHPIHRKMVVPVMLYSAAIGGMLLLAIWTIFRPDWPRSGAILAASGAGLFYFSDLYLAYDRFVQPKKHARLMVRITYHLGQLALAAGVILFTQGS